MVEAAHNYDWWKDFLGYLCLLPVCWLCNALLLGRILFTYFWAPQRFVYSSKKKGQLSPVMLTFLCSHFIHCLVCLANTAVWLFCIQHSYNPRYTYMFKLTPTESIVYVWIQSWLINYDKGMGSLVLFLVLERYLSVKIGLRFTNTSRHWLATLNIVVASAAFGYSTFYVLLPKIFAPADQGTFFIALLLASGFSKVVFGILTICATLLLMLELKRAKIANVKTRIVKMTVIIELLFHIIPESISSILYIIQSPWESLFYSWPLFIGSLDTLICGLYYSFAFFKSDPRNVVRASTTSQLVTATIHIKE